VKARDLIRRYNDLIAELPPNDNNPQPLPEDHSKLMLSNNSHLWDLERFHCNERWAKELKTRHAISQFQDWIRAEEELNILALECERFLKSQSHRLDTIQRIVSIVPRFSRIEGMLIEFGAKSEQALRHLQAPGMIKIVESLVKTRGEDCESFKKLRGISIYSGI
jgi:hypothetical protein